MKEKFNLIINLTLVLIVLFLNQCNFFSKKPKASLYKSYGVEFMLPYGWYISGDPFSPLSVEKTISDLRKYKDSKRYIRIHQEVEDEYDPQRMVIILRISSTPISLLKLTKEYSDQFEKDVRFAVDYKRNFKSISKEKIIEHVSYDGNERIRKYASKQIQDVNILFIEEIENNKVELYKDYFEIIKNTFKIDFKNDYEKEQEEEIKRRLKNQF